MVATVGGAAAILQEQALEAAVVGLATRIADAGADAARAPAFVLGQVGEVGALAFAGAKHVKAALPHGGEHAPDRFDRRARQRQVVTRAVDMAADAAEIGLLGDDDQRGVLRSRIAVIGPRIRVRLHVNFTQCRLLPPARRYRYLMTLNSAGAPISVRFGEEVTIMISRVRM